MSDPRAASRTVVFVLGMHRSGTSVTTAILNALGVSLSEDLMPPTEFNAMGYFESIAIADVHDKILASLGSAWNVSELFTPFPDTWWKLPEIAQYKKQLLAQVSGELERTNGVWGFKDPRTARLLPLWKEIVEELNLDARYVLVVRDPHDVAKSLQARENVPRIVSELLWLDHYVDVILELGDRLHAIVEYGRWFGSPMEQAESLIRGLGFEMPPRSEIEDVLARLVSPDLRHHQTATGAYALPYSRELYQALATRDMATIETLAQLFQVTRAFGSKVARHADAKWSEQLRAADQALRQSNARIAALEREAVSLRSMGSAEHA